MQHTHALALVPCNLKSIFVVLRRVGIAYICKEMRNGGKSSKEEKREKKSNTMPTMVPNISSHAQWIFYIYLLMQLNRVDCR